MRELLKRSDLGTYIECFKIFDFITVTSLEITLFQMLMATTTVFLQNDALI